MTDGNPRMIWLHEPGVYSYLGYEDDEDVKAFRRETYEGYSDAVFLSRWSYWAGTGGSLESTNRSSAFRSWRALGSGQLAIADR